MKMMIRNIMRIKKKKDKDNNEMKRICVLQGGNIHA